jgi:hypothetical protein
MTRSTLALGALLLAVVFAGGLLISSEVPTRSDPAQDLFDDTVVHDVHLSVSATDWATLLGNFLSNDYYPAQLSWRDNEVWNIGIRSRGNGSRSGAKPGLRVDFDRYADGQTFLGLTGLVLRNNTQDPSNMREQLSMAFFRRMALPAPREAFARVFVNDEYAGLYTLVEEVNKDFLTRTFGENGGYLYEYEYDAGDQPYYFEYRGSDADRYVPKPFAPQTHEKNPEADVIERMVHAIDQTGADGFRSAVPRFVDLNAFIRHVAIEVFLADQDGVIGNWGMNNFYLYRAPSATRFTFIVWDKSQAFADGPTSSIWHNLVAVPANTRNRLMGRAIEYADLRAHYLDMLSEASRSASDPPLWRIPGDGRGWLERNVDRLHLLIRDAVHADTRRPYSNDDFERAVEALRTFARQRPGFVDAEVAAARATRESPSP